MQKLIKAKLFYLVLGVTIAIGITSAFAYSIFAPNVGYIPTDTNWSVEDVGDALDNLNDRIKSLAFKKVCKYVSSTYSKDPNDRRSIGTEYECEVADNEKYHFYILGTNNKIFRLIMDRNINNGSLTWDNANDYFKVNHPGYSIKTSWTNVYNLDLPRAQEIVDASNIDINVALVGENWWCLGSGGHDLSQRPWCNKDLAPQQAMAWLFNHLLLCMETGCNDESDATTYGYWTTDVTPNNNSKGFYVFRNGYLENGLARSNDSSMGVRPVITVVETNLYG